MQTHIDIPFGDGTYTFALKLPQILAVEDKCGPIGSVIARIVRSAHGELEFSFSDLIEIVRQGLLGGATGIVDGQTVTVDAAKAAKLIDLYALDRPTHEILTIAFKVATARFYGYEPADDAQKKTSPRQASGGRRKPSTGVKSSPTVQ